MMTIWTWAPPRVSCRWCSAPGPWTARRLTPFLSFGPFPPTAMMKDYATCSIKYPRQSHHKCVVEIFLLCFVSRASARIFKGITPANSCFRWCIFPRWWNEKIESWKPNQDTILYRVPSFFFQGFIIRGGYNKMSKWKEKRFSPLRAIFKVISAKKI